MGETIAVSAVRNRSVDEVVQGICTLADRFGIAADALDGREADPEHDTVVRPTQNGWTIIFWPELNLFDAVFYQGLSQALGCLISTADIYDGGSWSHILVENGRLLDRFSSCPADHASAPHENERMRREWRGDAEVIAAHLNVTPDAIRPYLVHREIQAPRRTRGGLQAALQWMGLTGRQDLPSTTKAFPDDEYTLDDCWVFVDFWRRLGISYPGEESLSEKCVRFPGELLQERLLAEQGERE